MTVEIAIMNMQAVALAADSAGTIGPEGARKTFQSANKLFALSRHHPVGIMVYGNSALMQVPVETIIKMYRAQLGRRSFDRLHDYASDFVKFCESSGELFPPDRQDYYLGSMIDGFLLHIRKEVDADVKARFDSGVPPMADSEITPILDQKVRTFETLLAKHKPLPFLSDREKLAILERHRQRIGNGIARVLAKLPRTEALNERLLNLVLDFLCKDWLSEHRTGIAIAGFGTKDVFPRTKSFDVDAIIDGRLRLKWRDDLSADVSYEQPATIIPYAQPDVIETFMRGAAPGYEKKAGQFVESVINELPTRILEKMHSLSNEERAKLTQELQPVSSALIAKYHESIKKIMHTDYINPVMAVVQVLPKDELGRMAEALVNITALKRKVTMDVETVGGPIDVAAISKGDGFIWLRRKYYFESQINPDYLARLTEVNCK